MMVGRDTVTLTVTYNPNLVSEEFMAEHVQELEGVEWVRIDFED